MAWHDENKWIKNCPKHNGRGVDNNNKKKSQHECECIFNEITDR